jgi:gluconolactonase
VDLSAFSELAGGLDHPEGIAPAPDGSLFAGGEAGQVYAIAPDGTIVERASTGGFLYGVAVDGGGAVFACDFGRAEVARISPPGDVTTFTRGAPEAPLRVPNFAAFGDGGELYVTDSGEWAADDGLVLRVSSSGDAEVWSRDVPRFPNGCCVTADGTWLFVVESHGRCVSRIPIRDDGSAGAPEMVVELPGSQPDGIALTVDGTLYVGCYRPDRIYRIPDGGVPEIVAEDPDGVVLNQPTNVAFVGPARDRLAVASLGGWSIMVADVGDVGLPLRYPPAG